MTHTEEEPHWVNHDNMGQGEYGCWRQFRRCTDGNMVAGVGMTKQQAIDEAEKQQRERNEYLAKADPDRLEILLAKRYLLEKEMNEVIQILGKFALVQMRSI